MRASILLFAALLLNAETRPITLGEAVRIALRENPDLIVARLDEQRAKLAVRIAKDPFRPKLVAGSGLAYTYGFPMSVEGSAPSVLKVQGIGSILNRPVSYAIAQTTQDARTAAIDTQTKRDDIVLRTSTLFLDAAKWQQTSDSIRSEMDSLRRGLETVQARVKEGRELEIEAKRAQLAVAKTQHRLDLMAQELDFAQGSLAVVLGYPAKDRLRPLLSGPLNLKIPDSEEEAIQQSIEQSTEVRRLESVILSKRFELKKYKSEHLPKMDLVSQYSLLTKYNGYGDFFPKFQRNNLQLGVSVQLPLYASAASLAQGAQVEVEINGLRTQVTNARNRITLDTQNSFRHVLLTEHARELARLDLEVAREQVTILLAQMEEGRATLRQVEDARFLEQEKWIAYHDAQFTADRTRLELLRLTGELVSALQ